MHFTFFPRHLRNAQEMMLHFPHQGLLLNVGDEEGMQLSRQRSSVSSVARERWCTVDKAETGNQDVFFGCTLSTLHCDLPVFWD